jgi:Flp pilus assembly protein TadD
LELVDVEDGAQLWSAYFNRNLADIFDVQDQIATEISEKLRVRLSGDQRKRLIKHQTRNTEAYQLYMHGRFHGARRTEASIKQSLECFQLAAQRDPGYALAYAAIADVYLTALVYSVIAPRIGLPKARATVAKALELDDSCAEAHAALAYIQAVYDSDAMGSEKEFRHAMDLNPNNATTLFRWGICLVHQGRLGEAEAAMRRALETDPLSLAVNTYLGTVLMFGREYGAASEQLHKTLEMDPNFPDAHFWFAATLWVSGNREEAISHMQKSLALSGGDVRMRCVLAAYKALAGHKEEALVHLKELLTLAKQRYVSPAHLSQVYFGLGEIDKMFDLMEEGFQERDPALRPFFRLPALMDALETHPRFQDMQRRLGIAP